MAEPICKFSNKKPWYELLLSFINALVPIAVLVIGVCQFQKQQHFNKTIDFKRDLWNKKLESYTEIGELVGKIVSEKEIKQFHALKKEFEAQYWGKMILFEDPQVESSMKSFKKEVEDKYNNIVDESNPFRLEQSAQNLIDSCKKSLKATKDSLSK